MTQLNLIKDKNDDFAKSLNLNDEIIFNDLEKVKSIAGFPIGEIEDILDMSEQPYYTAYPNPYIKDFIEYFGTEYVEDEDDYNIEPFIDDLKIKKNNSIYRLHSYHTKMPYEGIEKLIKHYTKKNDIVLDIFSGTGMTGLASKFSDRNSILMDLSPIATLVSYNYNKNIDIIDFEKNVTNILNEIESEYSWLFETIVDGKRANVNFYVWSINYECPHCGNKFVYYDVAYDENSQKMLASFNCPHCDVQLEKSICETVFEDTYDDLLKENVTIPKFTPVLLNYFFENPRKSFEKKIDEEDLENIEKFNKIKFNYWVPIYKMLFQGKNWGDTWRAGVHAGIEYTHQFYYKRTLFLLSLVYDKLSKLDDNYYIFYFTSLLTRMFKSNRFMPKTNGSGVVGPLSGTLYLSQLQVERNPIFYIKSKLKDHINVKKDFKSSNYICSTQSGTDLSNIPDSSIDYIFIDPPFGDNLMYSELNFSFESWMKIFTNNKTEAIINKHQNKYLSEYSNLIQSCFKELFRVLKPNRWITVEFHNSRSDVWKSIQNSLVKSGFIIGQVSVLDKKKGTTKQLSYSGTVQNDLLISAYKPKQSFTSNFIKNSGLNLELDFLNMHLEKLPISKNIERTKEMLYSKLLAQYIQNGFEIHIDANEFYELLKNNFLERDGYWFLFSQEKIIDKNLKYHENIKGHDIGQLTLDIHDEKSAIIWLSNFLKMPKDYDEIYINFSKLSLTSVDKIPELKQILDDNFVFENGKYSIPSDFEKNKKETIRNKKLLKDFNELLDTIRTRKSKSKIKNIRIDSLRYGLMNLYENQEIDLINMVGDNVDLNILDSDDDISAIVYWARYK